MPRKSAPLPKVVRLSTLSDWQYCATSQLLKANTPPLWRLPQRHHSVAPSAPTALLDTGFSSRPADLCCRSHRTVIAVTDFGLPVGLQRRRRRTQGANGNELPRLPERKRRPGLQIDWEQGRSGVRPILVTSSRQNVPFALWKFLLVPLPTYATCAAPCVCRYRCCSPRLKS